MENCIYELKLQQNIRTNLSELRKLVKDETKAKRLAALVSEEETLWLSFLASEDAKTRKNVALLLGDIAYQPAADALWKGYISELTLFVKSSYLIALSSLDASPYLDDIKARIAEIQAMEISEENRKHMEEELRALRDLLLQYEDAKRHTWQMKGKQSFLLTTNQTHREIVKRSLEPLEASVHPLGVLVKTEDLGKLMENRLYREILFPLNVKGLLDPEPKSLAKALAESNLVELLQSLHAESDPFMFRVECKNQMTLEERSAFTKKLVSELERLTGGMLVNSTKAYEVELRLIANREGKLFPCVKCMCLPDHRFDYRTQSIAASIHPSTAALIAEIAKPYLKEDAQIMDPFCGVGTMLIERTKAVHAREIYATDIFGEAVEKGRENAQNAGVPINFIHRDFFDFKHDYLFDEFITNMPIRGKKTKEEMEQIYAQFFDHVGPLMTEDGIIIMYTNEMGFAKKQLRLHSEFALLQETLMQTKGEYYLLIIGRKR